MSWLTKVWNFVNPVVPSEERAVTAFDVFGNSDAGLKTVSGARVSEETAFQLSVAYAAMTLIADAISSLPPKALHKEEDGTLEPAKLPQWIRKPHPEIDRFTIWNQLMLSVLAWGNGYARIIRRPSDDVIIALLPLDPAAVSVEWDDNRPGYRHYRIDHTGPWLSSREIFHIQGPTLPGQAAGLSVIAQAKEAIGLGLTLEEFGARYFGQGSQAKIVIEMPQKIDTPDEAARIVKTFERFHKGRGNWHRPAIVSGGAKLHNISIPPDDAQFLETRGFQALEVARWFRVPPHRVGIMDKSTSWGSGLAEENLALLQHTYRPWITRFEAILTTYAPGGEDNGIIIQLEDEALLRGTFKEQSDVWTSLYLSTLVTKDEARIALGLGKSQDGQGNQYYQPIDPFARPGEPPKPGTQAPSANGGRTKEQDRVRKQNEAKS